MSHCLILHLVLKGYTLCVYTVVRVFRSTGEYLILLQKALRMVSHFKLADSWILEPAGALCSVNGLLHRRTIVFFAFKI